MSEISSMNTLLKGQCNLWLPLLSGSMAPNLLPGDQLFIVPMENKPQRGEILVFYRGGTFFCHRVLLAFSWRGKQYILEKGDGNQTGTFIFSSKILGRVSRLKRDGLETDYDSEPERSRSRSLSNRSLFRYIKHRIRLCIPFR